MTQQTMSPEIQCPKCKRTWHANDYFELHVGAEVECPNCRAVLQFIEEEVVRYWKWEAVREEKKVG